MGLMTRGVERRARRALDRQLDYQRAKAAKVRGHEDRLIAAMMAHSREIRGRIEAVAPVAADARVLEVGCGAHGLIFFFGAGEAIGVDPLADHYRTLFPVWQGRAQTIAVGGETLPFDDASFDVVLCDNVVDHALDPRKILEEMARVLKPGGTLYFEVNVHHPVYHAAATAHAAWRALGVPFEITPFADHTVHFTLGAAKALFDGLPLRKLSEWDDVEEVKKTGPKRVRHAGDALKKFFFKNVRYEVIAEKV
jgi:SAM-dependent methyltransferase